MHFRFHEFMKSILFFNLTGGYFFSLISREREEEEKKRERDRERF